jgi:hypothetical protein
VRVRGQGPQGVRRRDLQGRHHPAMPTPDTFQTQLQAGGGQATRAANGVLHDTGAGRPTPQDIPNNRTAGRRLQTDRQVGASKPWTDSAQVDVYLPEQGLRGSAPPGQQQRGAVGGKSIGRRFRGGSWPCGPGTTARST